jgi:DNA repair protein RadC
MEQQGIKFWAEDDRPREKLILKGKATLSDAELLAIIIGSGTRKKSAVELSREILSSYNNNLHDFSKVQLKELLKFNGIGEAKALNILAALELGRRRQSAEIPIRTKLTNSEMVYSHLKPYLGDLNHEEFYVIYLNFANEIIQTIQISKGGMKSTIADGKIIFKHALDCQASAFVLSHNHPSGNKNPSQSDIQLTKSLREFGKCIDLQLLDHLIFTDNGYLSFADEGLLSA